MAVPTFIQSQTYSTNTAGTSHQFSFSNAIRDRGGSIGPSTLVLTASYDGTAGDQISSISDSLSNTWVKGTSITNGATCHGEMWYCVNSPGGACTITLTLASSVKLTAVAVEADQIRPISALDLTSQRIDTTSSTGRTSAASLSTKRLGQMEVVIAGIGWTSASLTCSNGGAGFTGTLVTTKNASSGIGVGMARRTADLLNVNGTNSIGRFTMSASTTTPAAVMSLSFYRDGVMTTTSDDGSIQNIEGVELVDATSGTNYVFTSSASAPTGGTGSSEVTDFFFFFPDYLSSYLLSGVVVGVTFDFKFNIGFGYDDGLGASETWLHFFKSNQLGSTLDAGDYPLPADDYLVSLGTAPLSGLGFFTVSGVPTSSALNSSGWTSAALQMEATMGQGSYFDVSAFEGNAPAFIVLDLSYPSLIVPLKSMLGVGR